MTASAGATTAADEGLAAALRNEPAGAQAAIAIVGRDRGAREILHRELSKRYGADYQIIACGRPSELAPWMRDLRAAGLPVALVIGGVGAQDPDGIELLAAVRAIALGQLPVQDLPGATVAADDGDGRPCPGRFTAHGGGQSLISSGGSAS